jgi:hypothetical protein
VIRLAQVFALCIFGAVAWGLVRERPMHPADGILVEDAPRQHNYVDPKPPIQHGAYTLYPRAHYDITGRVLTRVRYRDDWWAALAPLDLSLGWQYMSDNTSLALLTISEHGRRLYEDSIDNSIENYYWVLTQSSNNHLIPENSDIESQLMAIRVGNVVELEGELVDVQEPGGLISHTSMVRNDDGDYACEIILVRRVKIKY